MTDRTNGARTGAQLLLALFPQARTAQLRTAPGVVDDVVVTIRRICDKAGNVLYDPETDDDDAILADELVPAEDFFAAAIEHGHRFAAHPDGGYQVLLSIPEGPALPGDPAAAELAAARAAVETARQRIKALPGNLLLTPVHHDAWDALTRAQARQQAAEAEFVRRQARASAALPPADRERDGFGFAIGDRVTGRSLGGMYYTGTIARIVPPPPYSGQYGNQYRLIDTGATGVGGTPMEPFVECIEPASATAEVRP